MSQVNLHQHSEGSFLDGLAKASQIAKRARELGSEAVAVTDHNEVNQHFAFQKACVAEGIKPILGIEADWVYDVGWTRANLGYPSNRSHICLLAENNKGLSNIWGLASLAYTDTYRYYKPLLTPDLMREYREGVWGSDGCMITEFGRAVERGDTDRARQHFSALLDVFGDHFYSELHTWQYIEPDTSRKKYLTNLMTQINQVKVQFATEMGVPLVVVNDSHHAYSEDWERKELVWKFNTHKKKGDDRDSGDEEYGQKADHLMGDAEVYLWMERHGISDDVVTEAIKNAAHIASRCNAEIVRSMEMPRLSQSEAEDLHILMGKVRKGFQQKVVDQGLSEEIYYARLEEELDLIAEKKFAGYFNVEQDLVEATVSGRWAPYVKGGAKKAPMLVGPGRGSAGGCLVAYLLGITSIDPIHYDLLFERFLDPSRPDYPDIDVDFPQSMRPDAKAYLEARYGHDHVCTIGTLSRSQPKQTLKDVARVLGIPPGDVVQMSKIIEQVKTIEVEVDEGQDAPSWAEVLEKKGGELSDWARQYPALFAKINEMSGMVRQSSRHASGVLVANKPILGTVPTRTRDGAPDAITQFDMYEVEELGACKFDLLGLRHLDTIMCARNLVYERHGKWLDFRDDRLPQEYWGQRPRGGDRRSFGYSDYADPEIWPAIAAGHTVGIFQLETPDLTRHAVQLKPKDENDVAVLISIVRPGVKDAGLGDVYLRRRAGTDVVEYDHPLMQSITKETYGVLVYQEQLLKTVKKLAGFTPAEANTLRRALGKKKMDQVLAFKDQFIRGCLANDGFTTEAAERIWVSIEAAGRYAFNKSHAVGYAIIGTWEVWLKHHYPMEFMTALLATDGENINRYVREARRMKFEILPPDINLSGRKFTLGPVGSKEIRYGLEAVFGLGSVACRQIDTGRPYRDFSDYLRRAGKKGADKTAAYNLVRIGAFQSMGPRDDMLDLLERERAKEGLAQSTLEDPEKLDARITTRLTNNPDKYHIERPDFSDPQVMYEIEKELVGSYILVDPLADYLEAIQKFCIQDPAEISRRKLKEEFSIGGQVTGIKIHAVKKQGKNFGQDMAFLTVQWNELDFDITVFPEKWTQCRDLIKEGVAVICEVARDNRGCHLKGDAILLNQFRRSL